MYKLLIVDDEPIVRIAVSSILNWQEYNIEIIGTAANGAQALELMQKQCPDIVICDIKMPVMSGIELIKESSERFGRPPLFIMLTSYEEFSLARQALHYQAIDYLVKLELDKNVLAESINKAIAQLQRFQSPAEDTENTHHEQELQVFHDKFLLRLIHNLFENEEQLNQQAKDLGISFNYSAYAACHCEIRPSSTQTIPREQYITLCHSSVRMLNELINKYIPAEVISLDADHFCILFCIKNFDTEDNAASVIENAITKSMAMVHNYFSVNMLFSIGLTCFAPMQIADSYQQARQVFALTGDAAPIVFYYRENAEQSNKTVFNLSIFKNDISRAFEEYDTETLDTVITEIGDLFLNHPANYIQAIDAACNILYFAINLLPDGEKTVSDIFADDAEGYNSIHRKTSVGQIAEWLDKLKNGLCEVLRSQRKVYKNHTVNSVQRYIREHITERLSLNDVSSAFGLSPNYLSMLFKKYSDTGFSEYITSCRINKAKELMKDSSLKVYEISDMLNFESAFYFSKVFKKVTGCSPKEYMQSASNFDERT